MRISLALLVVAACSSDPAVPPGDDTAGAGTQLESGGQVVGADGVRILATAGALASPVDVTIEAVPAPGDALPPGPEPLSGFYRISVSADVSVPADSTLVLGLPVPAGADTAHLAAVTLVSTAELVSAAPPVRNVWLPLAGRFDPERGLFVTALRGLSTAGTVFALIRDANLGSPSLGQAPRRSAVVLGHDFFVTCAGFDNHACPLPAALELADELARARTALLARTFGEPALALELIELGTQPTTIASVGSAVHLVRSDTWYCNPETGLARGIYYPRGGRLFLCAEEGTTALGTDGAHVADHEYFHSIQWAYLDALSLPPGFFTEGTASVAMRSLEGRMTRTDDWQLHALDVPLASTTELHAYEAQDFWVYVGRQTNRELDYLIPILQAPPSRAGIDAHLPSGDLHTQYFDLVTNNAFEKRERFDDQIAAGCTFESGFFPGGVPIWNQALPPSEGDLQPLTAHAIRLAFPDPAGSVLVENTSGDSNIKYKVFTNDDCTAVPEGPRRIGRLATTVNYVVIANTSFDVTAHYKIEVRP